MRIPTVPVSLALTFILAGAGGSLPILTAGGSAPADVRISHAAAPWRWPLVPRPALIRAFDPPARPWLSGHRGVDLGTGVDPAAVLAPAAGTISFVGTVVDRPVITVDHGNGYRSSFEPVESTLLAGMTVGAGEVLGRSLPGHCGALACIHWGVRRGEDYVNPLSFVVDLRPSVLLPPVDPAPG
ncbi:MULTISPECIES: M23 family metallopeptidase [Arthrobacter]|uniref:M23 family metallopeptidase n=1 Tax=Arthrobacter oryzae TaxID=409290 RepID=A0A3N0C4L9_9MICC|nr:MULTISPECIES: M23 family metallopeptidase [Arthrobacter]QYF90811.1 M23 family metallopeptidase [Arthrobacter sp. PAMC25284]RNL57608.1 M23 family metallopeptidase [Arthrobacter oryzae]